MLLNKKEYFLGTITNCKTGEKVSSSALQRLIYQKTKNLLKLNIFSGNRVIIKLTNDIDFFINLLSLWNLKACAIPVDPTINKKNLNFIIKHASVTHILEKNSNHYLEKNFNKELNKLFSSGGILLYTSGSTKDPKAVFHSIKNVLNKTKSLKKFIPLEEVKNTLCILPTYFAHGLISNSLFPLLNKCNLFLLPPNCLKSASIIGEIIDNYKITFISGVPFLWEVIIMSSEKPKTHSLQRIHSASAPLSTTLYKKIIKWSGIQSVYNIFGMTETCSWIAGMTQGMKYHTAGFIGKPWDATVKIATNRKKSHPLPHGEILIKTPHLMTGYYNSRNKKIEPSNEKWFNTGDLGYCDDKGNLFLTGRKFFIINKGGVKISPEELDFILMEHPLIQEACTFAIPDDIFGELIGAAIVLYSKKQNNFVAILEEWLEKRISKVKIPSKWFFLTKLNKTSRGKIDRKKIAVKCLRESKNGYK